MYAIIEETENGIVYRYDFETVQITACGVNGIRVRGARGPLPSRDWAITRNTAPSIAPAVRIDGDGASVTNGDIEARITRRGYLSFYRNGTLLLREYMRSFLHVEDAHTRSPLKVYGREYAPLVGGKCKATVRFESPSPTEKIYGMGQYQHRYLDLKGMELELQHRNTQSSVPLYLSSEHYAFFWNNPACGRVVFGKEKTTWEADVCDGIDYWICTGNDYKQLIGQYCGITGFAPRLPSYALGFWQSKLRYATQEEVLDVARAYKKRGLPLSVLVIDFFHWKHQGDWSFDERCWPDPQAMVRELEAMGIKTVVSVWPTVEQDSVNYPELLRNGYLTDVVYGKRVGYDFMADTVFIDVTNPQAAQFLWETVKRNYCDYGITSFWLDEAEPEYARYQAENYVYNGGSAAEVGNVYPLCYSKAFYDGLRRNGEQEIVNLVRCAWCGSQAYGALVWSGDINSSFEGMRNQLQAGLNIGMAGIPWWTSDIGGFHGGDVGDEAFRELLVRWFEWGTFCPVMRLHGDRLPKTPPANGIGPDSGAQNEVWSFGESTYAILKPYLFLREAIKPYLTETAAQASSYGYPMMRALFFEFPQDEACYAAEDTYMLGGDLLVAPIFEAAAQSRPVYLPRGCDWVDVWTGNAYRGGQTVSGTTELDKIPLFVRKGAAVLSCFDGIRKKP